MSDKTEDSDSGSQQSSSKPTFDVFISCAFGDKDVARTLASELRDQGLSCWFDERNLTVGEDLEKQIREGINKSRSCLVLLSSNTVPSKPSVSREWSAIQECAWRRPADFSICPVQLEDVDVPAFLRRWRGLRLKGPSRDMKEAANYIINLVKSKPSEQISAPSERDRAETAERFSEIVDAVRTEKDRSHD